MHRLRTTRATRRPLRAAGYLTFFVALALTTSAMPVWADELAIDVLSNRADLISGGDALVEVVVPADIDAADVNVLLNGSDVTGSFGVDGDGRFLGLVEGLVLGDNDLEAYVTPPTTRPAAAITITNYPIGGPIFSGEQLLPWICARTTATPVVVTVPGTSLSGNATTKVSGLNDNPVDEQCNTPSKFTFYYQTKASEGGSCTFTTPNTGTSCFITYDLANPPAEADIANFTNDRGDTVKSIIVVERGTVDRGIYELVSFYNPNLPNTPQDRQAGWNGKLLWSMGAASGPRRFEMPPTVSVFNANALSRGFMIASGSLTDHDTNSNDTLAAEFMMMVKEQLIENYGEVRYTIGAGCSGGAILQYNIAAAYPGLLDGIQPNCTFPDTLTTAMEVTECGLLGRHYAAGQPGNSLTTAKRTAINGHANANQCSAWVLSFLNFGNPALASNCGSGFPTSITYDAATRGDGVRCSSIDHDASMLGTYIDTDGNRKANSPIDNVGVQYGLKALAAGTITAEDFVVLNEGIGSYTADLVWVKPQRTTASMEALDTVYSAGLVSDGAQLAKTAIIDLRGQEGALDIHLNWRAMAVRARLDNANGNHDNQVIWATGGGNTPGAATLLKSFLTMDEWLHNIELDTSDDPIQTKVVSNKPAAAHDFCLTTNGATAAQLAAEIALDAPTCPVKFNFSPRQVAGGPRSEDIFKCQLKPINFVSADYNGVAFDAGQQTRLATVFPLGVCDWTLPGVGQVPSDGGSTFKNGPGGEPLGDAPQSLLVDPVCGDGEVVGEDCDDANSAAGDGCSDTCSVEAGFTCEDSPSTCAPICGDGMVLGGEACDDGNTSDTDGCSATCTVEAGFDCDGSPSVCDGICGDGSVLGTEVCDDGNTSVGDGCSAACTVETGFTCDGAPSACDPICGDGLVLGGEACDDANTSTSDGCSATCTVEDGFDCDDSEPSVCDGICGDGQILGTEACDDSADNGTLASCCSSSCQFNGTGTSCNDGNACTTSDTCNGTANTCVGGAAPNCNDNNTCTADSCSPATGCVNDAVARNGAACNDGNVCTQTDVCSGGQCAGDDEGADSDDDGYCDAAEAAVGCDSDDGAEIPAQPTTFGGAPGGPGDILVTYYAPLQREVSVANDPSCATDGVCGGTGFCTAGKISDSCSSNSDCDQAEGTCRVVANYAETSDLALRKPVMLNKTTVTGFEPLTPGCSRKVDIELDSTRRANVLKITATGTVGGKQRRDLDKFRYR